MYKRYERSKDSRIEWIGEIPEHWEENKLKYMAYVKSSNVDKKIEEDEQEVLLCNYTDVYYNDVIDSNIEFMKATAKSEEIDKFELQTGDVIITKDSETWDDIAVPAFVTSKLDKVLCGYHLALVKNFNNKSLGKYIFRAFSSNGIRDQFMVSANGITRFGLSISSIKSALFPCPPLDEQKSIAKFLDHKTSEIDSLIADKEKLINRLQEYKQSIITEAVTKGLNPGVKMKDSGVKWIGEIPEHWEVTIFKRGCEKITDGSHYSPVSVDSGYPYITVQNVYDGNIDFEGCKKISEEDYFYMKNNGCNPSKGDILLTKDGTIGRAAIVNEDKNFIVLSSLAIITPNLQLFTPCYLEYWLESKINVDQMFSTIHGAALRRLTLKIINKLLAVVPPLKEQIVITDYLEGNVDEINLLINNNEKQIQNLKSYRQSLIYEAVTGKIDVRDYQPERSEQLA